MELITVNKAKETDDIDRRNYKEHVYNVTRQEVGELTAECLAMITDIEIVVKFGDLEHPKARTDIMNVLPEIKKKIDKIGSAVLRYKYVTKLIDKF